MELVWIIYCSAAAFTASGSINPAECQALTIVTESCAAAVEQYKQSRAPALIAEGAKLYPGGKGFVLCEGQRFELSVQN